jgi:phosphotransferase system IIB component
MNNGGMIFCSTHDECINMRQKFKDSNIIYTGLYKTLASISGLIENGVNTVAIYNKREIQMLENIGIKYILKIKLNAYDIGIHKHDISDISKFPLNNIDGIWLVFSKQWFDENINSHDNIYSHDNTSCKLIIKKIKFEIYEMINNFLNNNHNLKIIILNQNTLDTNIFNDIFIIYFFHVAI